VTSEVVTADVTSARYVMGLGDDALVLAQRCAEWVTRAPALEEDVALANIGLDLLGQARLLLSHAGELEGRGRTEDDLAHFRDEREFGNVQLVELENGDFAQTMTRLLVFSSYQLELYRRLISSTDTTLAAVAGKAVKEAAYHRDHARLWVLRLGAGTATSAARMQAGLQRIWPNVAELYADDGLPPGLVDSGVASYPSGLRTAALDWVGRTLGEAQLVLPEVESLPGGGRRGIHTAAMGPLLAELQQVARSHPGAQW
jgi:ring-1,2-phenylacetyl-CoA epoxidase subunit PaaC